MMTRDEFKIAILDALQKVAKMHDVTLVSPLVEETVLLESGLDSLGFATLVASLDVMLDFDPFADAEVAFYPTTLAEFIDFYHDNQPKK